MILLTLTVGLIFGGIAGMMAFAITYAEYARHYLSKREPLDESMRAALFTFVVFLAISCLIGFCLSKITALP